MSWQSKKSIRLFKRKHVIFRISDFQTFMIIRYQLYRRVDFDENPNFFFLWSCLQLRNPFLFAILMKGGKNYGKKEARPAAYQ